jgi:hypothetical protein
VSPVSVIVIAAVPVTAPAVVSTIEVLVAVAAGVEVAVNDVTPLAMEVTVPKKYPAGMVSVMVPPIGTVVAGVNTRTGLTEAPATPPEVMEVNAIPAAPWTIATNVPAVLVSMTVLALSVVAAAMVPDAP